MKKRIVCLVFAVIFSLAFVLGCTPKEEIVPNNPSMPAEGPSAMSDRDLVTYEAEKSFRFLWEQVQSSGDGYGLVRDRYPGSPDQSSVASVGFALAALPIAVKNAWVEEDVARSRAEGTLKTFKNLKNYSGFYYHFYSMSTATPSSGSEVSVIDTALFLGGAITAGEFFGGNVKSLANELYERVDWNFFTKTNANGSKQFYMGYNATTDTFSGAWDYYAEQLIMYVLGAGAPKSEYRIDSRMMYDFARNKGTYGDGEPFIYSYFGSIFTYQFSHAFVDFRDKVDENGVNWFENSVNATIAARQYCIDNADKYATYGENSWGLTACDSPSGYNGYLGGQPSGYRNESRQSEGTIAPAGALGSIVFTPEYSIAALRHYYEFDDLRSRYGLRDAFNLANRNWYAEDVIGIDKGITVLMAGNYINDGIVWKYFMQNKNIRKAMDRLGFTEV